MTMNDVAEMTCDFITPAVAASVLKMDTGRLIGYARKGELPFPAVVSGNRVKIPRLAFLKAYGLIEEDRQEAAQMDQVLELMKEIRKLVNDLNVGLAGLIAIELASNPKAAELLDKLQGTMWNGGTKQ